MSPSWLLSAPADPLSQQAFAAAGVSTETGHDQAAARLGGLFDVHHQRLYRLARRMTSSADDARDLVQETFLRAARRPASVPVGMPNEEAWLVRVLINLCRDRWRSKAVRDRADTEQHIRTPPAASDPETAFIARTIVWQALDRLPPRRRAAIVLYELEGTTIPAIARLLGVAAVTVRWHLSRGRKDLAAILGVERRTAAGSRGPAA